MRVLILLFASSGLLLSAMAEAPSDSVDFRLEAHRWAHRLLLVFAPSDAGETVEGQLEAFDGEDASFRDRDLLLVTVSADGKGSLRETPGASHRPLTKASIRRLYERFDIPADSFRVILMGKDGNEKRRNAEPVTARSVFDTIDAMPMRQREMRDSSDEGKGGGTSAASRSPCRVNRCPSNRTFVSESNFGRQSPILHSTSSA